MSYVKPGMMAVVIPARDGTPMLTPGLAGRIVFVERATQNPEEMTDVNGQMFSVSGVDPELCWVVSANSPLPVLFKELDNLPVGVYHFYERPIADQCLKAISGPDLGVTEDEVRELYAPKETVSV